MRGWTSSTRRSAPSGSRYHGSGAELVPLKKADLRRC